MDADAHSFALVRRRATVQGARPGSPGRGVRGGFPPGEESDVCASKPHAKQVTTVARSMLRRVSKVAPPHRSHRGASGAREADGPSVARASTRSPSKTKPRRTARIGSLVPSTTHWWMAIAASRATAMRRRASATRGMRGVKGAVARGACSEDNCFVVRPAPRTRIGPRRRAGRYSYGAKIGAEPRARRGPAATRIRHIEIRLPQIP